MNKLQWNFNRNSYISIQENAFENIVWKIVSILSRPHCVKLIFILTLGPLSQGRVNVKMPSYKYWDSHYKEKTVSWLSYIHNRYPCTWTFILKQAKGTALISNKTSHCKISQSLEAMRFFYLELYDCCEGYLSSNTIRCLIEYWNGSQVFKGSTHGTDSLQVDELFSSSGFFVHQTLLGSQEGVGVICTRHIAHMAMGQHLIKSIMVISRA